MEPKVYTDQDLIQAELDNLIKHCVNCHSDNDARLIRKAFKMADDAHRGMRRKSGAPFILHPLAVARIVSEEIGLGITSIVCALLHDVVEDTDITIESIENSYGSKVATIIDGLTKISGVFDKETNSLQAENFRKMLLTLSDDLRVILIKLADRLHNMRTLEALPRDKQIKIAGETIYLYAPLAHRLGLYAIKSELEDLSLKYRYPEVYEEISEKFKLTEERRLHLINHFSIPIIDRLEKNGFTFDISGRPKSIYSIWQKMHLKNISFEEIYDLFAIRIIFEPKPGIPEKTQCWNIYSLITDIYPPKPDRIRDWVSTPKANGYEALHLTVMGPSGKWIEVQIRSRRMDEIAERGFAAHWKYKDKQDQESELDKWIKKIREMLDSPDQDALEFLDDFKLNLFATEIMAFTPKGHIRTLPTNATALDFAYDIHTAIGNQSIAAKVNHKLVPLSHVLKSGDQVEILTSATHKPGIDWLNYATTMKAKSAIKAALKAEIKNRTEVGKQQLIDKLNELNLTPSSRILKKILPAYDSLHKDELYSKIGSGIVTLDNLKEILSKNTRNKYVRVWNLTLGRSSGKNEPPGHDYDSKGTLLLKETMVDSERNYVIAKCCNPIPGDEVIGVRQADGSVKIHSINCSSAIKLMSSRGDLLVPAKWTQHKVLSYLARIQLSGLDRFGIYNQITTTITKELNINMRTINLHGHDGIFSGTIDLYVHNTSDLNNLILNLMKIKGVESVHRVEVKE
ncbi:MAG: bifunctional (p)ppGpp synthetase/guanosine-3',5'-bis(diphosphate) 3'-pyrophosphohydrolase [Bacteroidales bacterium]|nr:bifunctional (p)ppGpp synthetase/guanosine-3',5'-bis(diphosphate) 3'-pyrophosphohydrolase [Bacteroidales bacterium]